MEVETPLAESIRTIDKNAQLDAACKQVLAVKIILAWIMKCCLEEFRDHDVNEIAEKYIEGEPAISKVAVSPDKTNADQRIHGISNEDTSLTEGTVTYDIRFLARVPRSGELIRIIIDLEAQGNYYPGYPLPKRGAEWDGVHKFKLSGYQKGIQHFYCDQAAIGASEYDHTLSYRGRKYGRQCEGTSRDL